MLAVPLPLLRADPPPLVPAALGHHRWMLIRWMLCQKTAICRHTLDTLQRTTTQITMRSILLLPLIGGCASALRVSRAPLPRLAPRASRRCAAPLLALETPADIDGIWDKAPSVRVEGDSLKTWNFGAQRTERVQVSLRSPGRPIHSNVELWHTPGRLGLRREPCD